MNKIIQPDHNPGLSRRDFLRLNVVGTIAALGIAFRSRGSLSQLLNKIGNTWIKPDLLGNTILQADEITPDQQGRVLNESIDVFDLPSFNGRRVNTYFRDWVLPLSGTTVGSSEDSFNMVWYRVGDEGYTHSGSIQPVLTKTNPVNYNIPPEGVLAEVTVPFTDARWKPGIDELVAYRFYYDSTYWVMEIVQDNSGNPWYSVRDDKWDYLYYVSAPHLRIIPPEELNPISPEVPKQHKRIDVHLPEQVLIAYEYDKPVFMARVATGAVFSNGDFSTPAGKYITFHKRSSRHMARGNLAANGYDLPGVPWNSYITEEGIAFHGTYWHNNFGRPRSHGCINLTPRAAKWIFLWTMPTVPPDKVGVYKKNGTMVEIFA